MSTAIKPRAYSGLFFSGFNRCNFKGYLTFVRNDSKAQLDFRTWCKRVHRIGKLQCSLNLRQLFAVQNRLNVTIVVNACSVFADILSFCIRAALYARKVAASCKPKLWFHAKLCVCCRSAACYLQACCNHLCFKNDWPVLLSPHFYLLVSIKAYAHPCTNVLINLLSL